MSVQPDHAIVPARERKAAAEWLAIALGVPWAEPGAGPLCPVDASDCDGLTLDFDQADGLLPAQDDRFRVNEAEFDGIVAGIGAWGIEYRRTPHGPVDMQANTQHGERIVHWNERDGHAWEILTVSDARKPRNGTQGDA